MWRQSEAQRPPLISYSHLWSLNPWILSKLKQRVRNGGDISNRIIYIIIYFPRKQDQRLAKARQEQEALAKNARFYQIWRSRRGANDELNGSFRFYDVMRVDDDERQQPEDISPEDQKALSNYLPLLREFIPDAAAEIEPDIQSYISNQAMPDGYVYDFYTVKDDMDITEEDALHPFPLVQVDDEDFYGVCYESEYETDDSNAEDNPRNEYPCESSEDEDKSEKENSETKSEDGKSECSSNQSSEPKDSKHLDLSDGERPILW